MLTIGKNIKVLAYSFSLLLLTLTLPLHAPLCIRPSHFSSNLTAILIKVCLVSVVNIFSLWDGPLTHDPTPYLEGWALQFVLSLTQNLSCMLKPPGTEVLTWVAFRVIKTHNLPHHIKVQHLGRAGNISLALLYWKKIFRLCSRCGVDQSRYSW